MSIYLDRRRQKYRAAAWNWSVESQQIDAETEMNPCLKSADTSHSRRPAGSANKLKVDALKTTRFSLATVSTVWREGWVIVKVSVSRHRHVNVRMRRRRSDCHIPHQGPSCPSCPPWYTIIVRPLDRFPSCPLSWEAIWRPECLPTWRHARCICSAWCRFANHGMKTLDIRHTGR